MGLIISNGSRTNIEKSITGNTLGNLVSPPIILDLMRDFPFINNQQIIALCNGDIKCWGFQNSSSRWKNLYNAIQTRDRYLLFENKYDKNIKVSNPSPRIFCAEVVHMEPNLNFGNALWEEEGRWHYIYFLTKVKELESGTKQEFCKLLKLANQFAQHRKEHIPPAIEELLG